MEKVSRFSFRCNYVDTSLNAHDDGDDRESAVALMRKLDEAVISRVIGRFGISALPWLSYSLKDESSEAVKT
jgi:hypothetical protein